MKMHKKNRIFPFIMIGIILLCSLYLFSSCVFPGETHEDKEASPPPETPENQDVEKRVEPALASPPDRQTNPDGENNTEEGEKTPSFSGGTGGQWDGLLPEIISFLQVPLPGAHVSTRDSQLPGAPRPYRNGVHEGLDFYSSYCGIEVNYGDPVFAAGPGILYRIDHVYEEPSVEAREIMLQTCWEEGGTPAYILDILRGRQVWIAHPHGLVTRYAHLSKVAEHLQEGDRIEAGDYLGQVGNSGTDEGARGENTGAHLHFEIWLEDNYLGAGLTPGEVRSLWKTLLE